MVAVVSGETSSANAFVSAETDRLLDLGQETLESLPTVSAAGISGAIGDAIYACALRRRDPRIDVARWIRRAVDDFNSHGGSAALHTGVAGLGFVLAAYTDELDMLPGLDAALIPFLPEVPPASLQSGAAGIGLYASLRMESPSGRELADAVIASLTAAAVPSGGGLIWHTPAAYARLRTVDVLGEPVTEFGMVHGVAGTLVSLAALSLHGHPDAADLAQAGVRGAWSWMGPVENRFGRVSFGDLGSSGTLEFDDRWCVGDIGVLRAIHLASTTVGDSESAERALDMLREEAVRDAHGSLPGESGRLDLCCGATPFAQIYWRLFQETGEEIFRTANRRILRRCAEGVAGLENPSLAYGRLGVILAILTPSAEHDVPWDAIFGHTLPRRVVT